MLKIAVISGLSSLSHFSLSVNISTSLTATLDTVDRTNHAKICRDDVKYPHYDITLVQ